jgi:lipid-binding SYLF domain-containing protein
MRVSFVLVAFALGCASAPKSESKRAELQAKANETLQLMVSDNPELRSLLDQAVGYVVLPEVKQGGFIVGGAGGEGVVYEQGRVTGYAELSQASVGAQIGGQKYAELIIVRDRYALDRMKAGNFDFGAEAQATIIRKGVATATDFNAKGVAVIIKPIGGAMASASLTGQQLKIKM